MTTQEAIKQLDGADAMLFNRNMVAFNKAIITAIRALQEKAEREDPKPLTIEELSQMNGEPVYLDGFEWRVSYGVSTINGSLCLATGFDSWIPLDGYGETWFAYRHKPKEE